MQDAHEFLVVLLNAIEEEQIRNKNHDSGVFFFLYLNSCFKRVLSLGEWKAGPPTRCNGKKKTKVRKHSKTNSRGHFGEHTINNVGAKTKHVYDIVSKVMVWQGNFASVS